MDRNYKTAFQQVFGNDHFLPLIFAYQYGVPKLIADKLKERYQTIYNSIPMYKLRFQPNFREVKCFGTKYFDASFTEEGLMLDKYHRDRRFALHLAIAEGDFDMVKLFYKHVPSLFTPAAVKCAVNFKQVQIALWLNPTIKNMFPDTTLDFDQIELEKHQLKELSLEKAITSLETDNLTLFTEAVGHVDFYEKMHILIDEIVKREKFELIEAAIQFAPGNTSPCEYICSWAATYGNTKLWDWLIEKYGSNAILDGWTQVHYLIQSDQLDVLRWFYTTDKARWQAIVLPGFTFVQSTKMVDFLVESGLPLYYFRPWTVEVAQAMLDNGLQIVERHFSWSLNPNETRISGQPSPMAREIVQICQLFYSKCPEYKFTQRQIDDGIRFGVVEFVQFCHTNKIKGLNDSHLSIALQLGDYENVKYMHEVIGWPIPDNALYWVMKSGPHDEDMDYLKSPLLQYIVSLDKERIWPSMRYHMTFTAETIKWLICQHCIGWNDDLLRNCLRFGCPDFLEYIAEHTSVSKYDVDSALREVIISGSFHLLDCMWTISCKVYAKELYWSSKIHEIFWSQLRNAWSHDDDCMQICKRFLERIQISTQPNCTVEDFSQFSPW